MQFIYFNPELLETGNYDLQVFIESSKDKIEFSWLKKAINFFERSTVGQAKKKIYQQILRNN